MISIEIILVACIVLLVCIVIFLVLKMRCYRKCKEDQELYQHSTMSIIYDSSLNIIDIINPNDALLFYIPLKDLIGNDLSQVVNTIEPYFRKQIEIIHSNITKAATQKKNQYFEYNVTQKNGKLLYAICVVEYIDENRLCCHIIDVDSVSFHTERKSFVHSIFDSLSENTEVGIYIRSVNEHDKNYLLFNNITKSLYATDDVALSPFWDQQQEDEEDKECMRSNTSVSFDREITDNNGVKHYFKVSKRLIQTEDGYSYINATMTDLTELKHKSMVLQDAVLNLELAVKASNSSVWRFDVENKTFSALNSEYLMSLEECRELLYPKSRDKYTHLFDKMIAGESERESMELQFKGSEKVPEGRFACEMAVVRDQSGKVSHIIGTRRDVSNEYKLQKEIKDNLRIQNTIYENTPIGLAYFDKDGYVIQMNTAFFSMLGQNNKYSRTENKLSILDDDALPQSIRQSLRDGIGINEILSFNVTELNITDQQADYFHEHKHLHFDLKCIVLKSPDGNIEGYVSICSDITDIIESNKKIEELYKQQETILDMLPVGVELYNSEGTLTYQNQQAQILFGCGDISNQMNIFDNPNIPSDLLQRAIDGEDVSFEIKFDFNNIIKSHLYDTIHKDTIKYIKITAKAIRDTKDNILHYAAIIMDTTESVEARKHIEDTILKLNMIIDNSAITPWDYDCKRQMFVPYQFKEYTHTINEGGDYLNHIEAHPENAKEVKRCIDIMQHGVDERFSIDIKYRFTDDPEEMKWKAGILAGEPFERNAEGQVIKYIGFLKDTTQFFELNDQLSKVNIQNQLVLNNTQSGFVYFTPDYQVQWENVSMAYPQYTMSQLYKKGSICYRNVKGFDTPCNGCILPLAIKNKAVYSQEVCIGEGIYAELIVTPALNHNGDLEGVVMRVDDITERRRINHELQTAKENAEQSNRLKSAFLANMSHEIRTPLNAIVGFSNIVMETEDAQEREEYRNIITTNSEMLLNLINDILDLSKIESGYLEIVPTDIDLVSLFNEFETSFSKRTKENVDLLCNNPYDICQTYGMDKQRVLQIMTNLLSNAVKFTRKGSVTIGYECLSDLDGIRLYVKDTGIGISEENCKKVFQRFQKFDTFAQGTGLGLSICRAMVDAMKGEIGFESTEGVGTTFWAKIPCQIKEVKKREKLLHSGDFSIEERDVIELNKRLNILIAEDNVSNYVLMKALLRNHRLVHALNGNEVVAYAENDEYDVILMDINMPHMDGYQATTEIRRFNKKIPIIALTANAFDADKEKALAAGCNDWITKPVSRENLFKIINQLI